MVSPLILWMSAGFRWVASIMLTQIEAAVDVMAFICSSSILEDAYTNLEIHSDMVARTAIS